MTDDKRRDGWPTQLAFHRSLSAAERKSILGSLRDPAAVADKSAFFRDIEKALSAAPVDARGKCPLASPPTLTEVDAAVLSVQNHAEQLLQSVSQLDADSIRALVEAGFDGRESLPNEVRLQALLPEGAEFTFFRQILDFSSLAGLCAHLVEACQTSRQQIALAKKPGRPRDDGPVFVFLAGRLAETFRAHLADRSETEFIRTALTIPFWRVDARKIRAWRSKYEEDPSRARAEYRRWFLERLPMLGLVAALGPGGGTSLDRIAGFLGLETHELEPLLRDLPTQVRALVETGHPDAAVEKGGQRRGD